MMTDIRDFIFENLYKKDINMEAYKTLNQLNIRSQKKEFPYNILKIKATPTYKQISLEVIQGKSFYRKRNGGGSIEENSINIFIHN